MRPTHCASVDRESATPSRVGHLLQPVQRQVVQVFADDDPDVQADRRQTTVDHGRGDGRRSHRFAGPAGVLRADVAVNEESGGFDVELFADVFTDLDQVLAALPAGTGFRFVAVFDARQGLGQGLATGAFTRRARSRLYFGLLLRQFGLGRGHVTGQGLLEQVALLDGQGFAPGSKAHPPQVGEFEGKGLDLGLGGVQLGIAAGELRGQSRGFFLGLVEGFLNATDDPVREFRGRVETGQFSA